MKTTQSLLVIVISSLLMFPMSEISSSPSYFFQKEKAKPKLKPRKELKPDKSDLLLMMHWFYYKS